MGLDKTRGDFVAALTALLGEYATKLDQEAVLAADKNRGRGATPELVVLIGRRFVYVDELEEGRQLDEARVKALTGSERATGRALYQNMREWRNTAKLWMDLNHLPAFKGVDFGIERRPRVIAFDRRFEEHEQDKQMPEKLVAELPGILAWAVEGCKAWRQRGLDPPEAVSLATRRYRDENNHLPAFFEDQYVAAAGARVTASDVQRTAPDVRASRRRPSGRRHASAPAATVIGVAGCRRLPAKFLTAPDFCTTHRMTSAALTSRRFLGHTPGVAPD